MPILNFNFSMIPSFPICKTLDLHNYIDFKTATPSAILINFKKTENLALAMLLEDRLKSLNRGRSIHSLLDSYAGPELGRLSKNLGEDQNYDCKFQLLVHILVLLRLP